MCSPGRKLLLDDGKLLARVDTAEPEAHSCAPWCGAECCKAAKASGSTGADGPTPTLTTEDKENLAIAAGCGVTGACAALCARRCGYPSLRRGAGRGQCSAT
ncbi:MAG: hypothetical protein ACLT9S_02015 [Faecalibacterium sp.]